MGHARIWLVAVPMALAIAAASCRSRVPSPASSAAADLDLKPDTETLEGRVARNATLDTLLRDLGVGADVVPLILERSAPVFDARTLKAGQPYRLVRTLDGGLRGFEYEIDVERFLRIEIPPGKPPAALTATVVPYELERVIVAVRGSITDEAPSLFEAMERAGEKADLSLSLADVFSADIDFNTDLQPGDTFAVAVEKVFREGVNVAYGAVVAAEFRNEGRLLRAVRFTPPGGKSGFYDTEGRSLRRFFLKSPLKFAPRISSGFSRGRLHPILRIVRPHLGVDYMAPEGSPVVAVAAGTVVSAGWNGEGGRTVHLRHPNGYETLYMHLSSIAVRAGARVAQGDLVGRVGTTGLSTGPHLDYRVRRNGIYVNPVLEHKRMPPGEPIAAALLPQFEAERDGALVHLRPEAGATGKSQ